MHAPNKTDTALLERAYDQADEPTDAEILDVVAEAFGMSKRRVIERLDQFDFVAAVHANTLPDDHPAHQVVRSGRAIAMLDQALAIVKSDGHAATFQTIGHYRTSIIATLGGAMFSASQHIHYLQSALHLADALINHHRMPATASAQPNVSEVRR